MNVVGNTEMLRDSRIDLDIYSTGFANPRDQITGKYIDGRYTWVTVNGVKMLVSPMTKKCIECGMSIKDVRFTFNK